MIILCYHSVDDSGSLVSVTPGDFARQMAHLAQRGFTAVALERAMAESASGGGRASKLVALTFDDGYRSLLGVVRDVLRRHGFGATVYLPTNYVGAKADWPRRDFASLFEESGSVERQRCALAARMPAYGAMRDDALAHTVAGMQRITQLDILSWDEVRQLAAEGIRFGSHAITHPFLTSLDKAEVEAQVRNSRQQIAQATGTEVESFCYPYGDYDATTRTCVKDAGYRYAVTVWPGISDLSRDDPLALPRVSIDARCRLEKFAAYLTPIYRWYANLRWSRRAA